jgi:hypothetical protein
MSRVYSDQKLLIAAFSLMQKGRGSATTPQVPDRYPTERIVA